MEWKIKLAQLGFTVLQDDKPQLYLRQLDVEKFIEQNFVTQQQVSVEPEVKPANNGHKCESCGKPLSNYCDNCQKLWES